MGKAFIAPVDTILGGPMDKKLDEYLKNTTNKVKPKEPSHKRKKRLKSTSLESFLPEEYVNYFRGLHIGSKRIRNAKIDEL